MPLLYKELRLAAHPTSIVFAFLGCLVLVPAYPYSVIFLFGCLAPYITFVNARETNDLWYTAVLPVTKRESVLGKCLLVVCFQLFQLLFSLPFALLRHALKIANNCCVVWVWAAPIRGVRSCLSHRILSERLQGGNRLSPGVYPDGRPHGSDRSHRSHPGAGLDGQLPARASVPAVANLSSWDGLLRRIDPIGLSDFRQTL